jgi:hypothetical protein
MLPTAFSRSQSGYEFFMEGEICRDCQLSCFSWMLLLFLQAGTCSWLVGCVLRVFLHPSSGGQVVLCVVANGVVFWL